MMRRRTAPGDALMGRGALVSLPGRPRALPAAVVGRAKSRGRSEPQAAAAPWGGYFVSVVRWGGRRRASA